MPNKAVRDKLQDYALGYLLIDFAQVNLQDTGSPVNDEELSVFLESHARDTLGSKRCEQILAQLTQDSLLYQRWLMLNQSRIVDGEFGVQPAVAEAVSQTAAPKAVQAVKSAPWLAWLQGLFVPRLSFASAFGVMGVAVLAAYLTLAPQQQQPMLVQQGDVLPGKASQAVVGVTEPATVGSAALIVGLLQCVPLGSESSACYSATRHQQHWFVTRGDGVQAVTAPVSASKIVSVRTQGFNMLVEYSDADSFRLALMAVALTDQGWDLKPLHEDVIQGGYFDQLQLDSSQLTYNRIKSGSPAEPVQITYGE